MGRCSYKISRVWVPQLIVGIIGFELRTMNTSMFFLSTAAAMTVAHPSPVHYEEDGGGAVGPWKVQRTLPYPLLAGGCHPGPSWRGGCGGVCLPTRTWCFLFPPPSGATSPPVEQMEGCQTYPQLSHRHSIRNQPVMRVCH